MDNISSEKKYLDFSKFTTSDIIIISLFGAIGIIAGCVGNIFHGLSSISVIGPFILHTLIPGTIVFACASTVKKAGSATLYSLLASLVSMTLMGVPIFIAMYVAQGLLIDGLTLVLKEKMWTKAGVIIGGTIYGVVGILMLYYVVLASQGLHFPAIIVLMSIPLNIIFALPAALIGLKIGTRASLAVIR